MSNKFIKTSSCFTPYLDYLLKKVLPKDKIISKIVLSKSRIYIVKENARMTWFVMYISRGYDLSNKRNT